MARPTPKRDPLQPLRLLMAGRSFTYRAVRCSSGDYFDNLIISLRACVLRGTGFKASPAVYPGMVVRGSESSETGEIAGEKWLATGAAPVRRW